MTLAHLDPVAPTTKRPERPPEAYLPMQRLTRQIAFEPDAWGPERKAEVTALFDGLAPEWHTRGGPDRLKPTADALVRGAVPARGRAIEIGSGTGIQTGVLLEHFDSVVSVELSTEMLGLAPRLEGNLLLRADASRLAVRDSSVQAVVCVNAYLFPAEYSRVLVAGGRVVFVSTSGERTPIYLPPEEVLEALEQVTEIESAATSRCGWGIWTVVALAG